MFRSFLGLLLIATVAGIGPASAQSDGGTTIVIDDPNFQPQPIAIASFLASPALASRGEELRQVVEADLERSGLFRIIPRDAHVAQITDFNTVPQFADWRAISASALMTGFVTTAPDGRLAVQFRLFDADTEEELLGEQVIAGQGDWRRLAHRVADKAYSTLTGEGPYFDSRVVFVAESGSKRRRQKRLAVMDQDGANLRYLSGGTDDGLVLGPRFSPNDDAILYVSYNRGTPEVVLIGAEGGAPRRLGSFPGMTFAPQFSPDGRSVILSLSQAGNTDIWAVDVGSGERRRLTRTPGIETSPSYSPDGSQIVFESDRSGRQQLYVMSAGGGEPRRISFGSGSYATPVWSPKGDLIAFTKIQGGRFAIGVMRADGSDERILDAGFNVEGPTFSPNGRVLMYFSETPGESGQAQLYSIDVSGRNKRRVDTLGPASDPGWSPLRR